jgi:Amt family ammonium transporter
LRRKLLTGLGLTGAVVLALAAPAFAQGAPTVPDPGGSSLAQTSNILWIIVAAVLVIFMQAGFALVETGFCRAKHASHVVSTNFAIFGLGFVGYFICGYAFMFGGYSDVGLSGTSIFGYTHAVGKPLIGSGQWVFLWQGGFFLTDLVRTANIAFAGAVCAYFLYMVAFMDTTATIPTGAMAERWKWKSFVAWGLFCGAIYYPLFGAWTWGGGWLNQLGNSMHLGFGYVDFAGSGVVHAMGGIAGLAGALVLGPRIGKIVNGKAVTLAGHHIPMAFLGTFILLVGWFGFNAGSTLAATDLNFAVVATNTALAAAFGATVAMFYTMLTGEKKPDPGMMANGMLAGLVAITAPCAFVDPYAAAIIGSVAGVLVIWSVHFVDRLKIDDPVGAVSVHYTNGIWGILSVAVFANGQYGAGWNLTTEGPAAHATGVTGIFTDFSLGMHQMAAQVIGALVITFVMGGFAFLFFKICNAVMKGGIRTDEATELAGVDVEMTAFAYPDFVKIDPDAEGDGRSPDSAKEPTPV